MREAIQTISVYVNTLSGGQQVVELPVDSTVLDALTKAGLAGASDVRCGDKIAKMNDLLDDGDILVVSTNKITQG